MTKSYLDESFKKFEKKMEEKFVSKEYLDMRFEKHTEAMMKYIEFKLEPLEEIKRRLDALDPIIKNIDWLTAEYIKFQQEHTILSTGYMEVNDRTNSHKDRIHMLEEWRKKQRQK